MWIQAKSKDLSYLDIVKEHIVHRKRLNYISSRIDNSAPRLRPHVLQNLKGKILNETKQDKINNSNKILVDKLIKLSSRENSTQNNLRDASWRHKKFEDLSLSIENSRILQKLRDSKSHYSSEKLKNEYKYSFKLKKMLQKQSFRFYKHNLSNGGLNAEKVNLNLSQT